MSKFNMTFFKADRILPKHKELIHRQVYGWMQTTDDKIALVSKDGAKWQFPGGKPAEDESFLDTLKREVYEETGISLDSISTKPKFFGYYVVDEIDEDKNEIINSFLQIRYKIALNNKSDSINLEPKEIDTEDFVKYANFFTIKEAADLISWLHNSDELKAFNLVKLI